MVQLWSVRVCLKCTWFFLIWFLKETIRVRGLHESDLPCYLSANLKCEEIETKWSFEAITSGLKTQALREERNPKLVIPVLRRRKTVEVFDIILSVSWPVSAYSSASVYSSFGKRTIAYRSAWDGVNFCHSSPYPFVLWVNG